MTRIIDLDEHFGMPPSLWGPKIDRIWYAGDLRLLGLPRVSIVGTRKVTPIGRRRTKKLVEILVSQGFCIVSGLAAGVDTVAHETTLETAGKTIAVLGTPIDECYPKENQSLKEQIAQKGLVLSQFAPGQPVERANFPRRNALMALLSAVTFVVEAEIESGTRHQVWAALALGQKIAFLASLVDRNFPWVRKTVEMGNGVVIKEPEDALRLLRDLGLLKENESTDRQKADATSAAAGKTIDQFTLFKIDDFSAPD